MSQRQLYPGLKIMFETYQFEDGYRYLMRFEDGSGFFGEEVFKDEKEARAASMKWAESHLVREQ
jgi:hypothetical protein